MIGGADQRERLFRVYECRDPGQDILQTEGIPMKLSLVALLGTFALVQAAPASAQGSYMWPPTSIGITHERANQCRPAIVSVTARPGQRKVDVRIHNPGGTATVELSIETSRGILGYRGGANQITGSGTLSLYGPEIPELLLGSRVSVSFIRCVV